MSYSPNKLIQGKLNAISLCFCLIASTLAIMPSAYATECLEDACFNTTAKVGSENLYLSGVGKDRVLWMDVYTAALYLPKKVVGLGRPILDSAKILILEYHRQVEKEKIIREVEASVLGNPTVEPDRVRERFRALTEAFDSPEKGSRYVFVYLPESGTSLVKDGRVRVTIPGADFASAFFGLWTSPYGKNQSLRRKLLGGSLQV